MAVTVPKQICVDEAAAKHVAHDISAKLSQVPTSASNLAQSREGLQMTAACSLSRARHCRLSSDPQ
jgi:hypothetical protein